MTVFLPKLNLAVAQGVKSMVATRADADTGPNFGTPLAHKNHAGGNLAAAKMF